MNDQITVPKDISILPIQINGLTIEANLIPDDNGFLKIHSVSIQPKPEGKDKKTIENLALHLVITHIQLMMKDRENQKLQNKYESLRDLYIKTSEG